MNLKDTRIVFMGTPHIAATLLEALLKMGANIIALIAQPDSSIGRKRELQIVPTKQIALEYGIQVYQPESIRREHSFINDFSCDLIVTLAYGQIVPDAILDWPRLGALNFHGSLLPKYRGAAPMQYALLNGDTETGFTLMEMVSQMDAGAMRAHELLPILPEDDYESLSLRMGQLIANKGPSLLERYLTGQLPRIAQDESKVSFAPSIKPEQEKLDLSLTCYKFVNYIRALAPQPGAYILEGELRVKLLKARLYDNLMSASIGSVMIEGKKLLLQLQDGRISVETLQYQGRKPIAASDFINGARGRLPIIWK